jgi:hypothetical protein
MKAGVGVRLGSLGTATADEPIVSAWVGTSIVKKANFEKVCYIL